MLSGTVEFTLLVLLTILFAGPMLVERVRIPGLLGLIFFGMLFGPNVLGWLGRVGLVEDLGSIGILYLMFLAGLSFDLRAFFESRREALTFGVLGFVIPFVLSIWVGLEFLDQPLLPAALIGAMWASNTLVAYPDVRAAGLADNRAVSSAVSAGVVADLMSLLVLAVATSAAVIELNDELAGVEVPPKLPLPIVVAVPLLVGFTLLVLPRLGGWFFTRVGHSRVQRLLFSLAGMAAGATLAVIGGLAGIIGAFLAGLGLNTLVPSESELMDRIDFLGTTIFIPAFLVSIGLTIDPAALFDFETLRLGLIFTGLVVVGKTTATLLAGVTFKYSFAEMGLMASLSFGQAASTLAIAQVGLSLGIFDQSVVNGAILAIVLTALATATFTRVFIRRMPRPETAPAAVGDRILVDARRSSSDLETVMEFAGRIAATDGGVMTPFTVLDPTRVDPGRVRIEEAEQAAAAAGHDASGLVRVSESFTTGTLELVVENQASLVVIPWVGPRFGSRYVFGSDLDAFGSRSPVPTVAAQLLAPWNRVVLVLGDFGSAWRADDADLAVRVVRSLVKPVEDPLLAFTRRDGELLAPLRDLEGAEIHEGSLRPSDLVEALRPDDLLVLPVYVVRDASLPDQLRMARDLSRYDFALVAGPRRMTITNPEPHRAERIVGRRW